MPKQRRRETDYKIFVAGLKDHPDDVIVGMAVANRVAAPAGEYGQLARDALAAEAARRGLSSAVDVVAEAAIAQAKAIAANEECSNA